MQAIAYGICLLAYGALMLVSLAVCGLLFLVPSQRPFALRLCLATLLSLPGVLLFQAAIAVPLGILLVAVLGFYALFHPAEWIQFMIGFPTIVVMLMSLAAVSLFGSYTGGRIGWQMAKGMPFRSAVAEQKIVKYLRTRFKR